MMKKVLLIASTASMIKQFNMHNLQILKDLGYEVHVAANFKKPGTITSDLAEKLKNELIEEGYRVFDIPFGRGIGDFKSNLAVLVVLIKLFLNEKYFFIHVHAALASVLVRIAAIFSRTTVIYTVHGFQFSKESSFKRWVVFFPIEFLLSFITNIVITINDDDYTIAKKYFIATKVVKIPGIGIDFAKFSGEDLISVRTNRVEARHHLNIDNDAVAFITVGELSDRKNQRLVIEALHKLNNEKIYYLLVGIGKLEPELKNMVSQFGLGDRVKFLGYSENLSKWLSASDAAIFPSKLEGLMTAGLEAGAAGLPIIGSNVRGIRDYIGPVMPELLFSPQSVDDLIVKINHFMKNMDKYKSYAHDLISEYSIYSTSNVNRLMREVYLSVN